jgi:hypothetical protein
MSLVTDVLKVIASSEWHVKSDAGGGHLVEVRTAKFFGPCIDTDSFAEESKQVGEIIRNSGGINEETRERIRQVYAPITLKLDT